MKLFLQQSKMARRLVRLFALMVVVPLIVTVLLLGYVGREQIIRTAHAMEEINASAVQQAGEEFQRLGRQAIDEGSQETSATARKAIQSISQTTAEIQKTSLTTTANDLMQLTHHSFDGGVRRSLATHRRTLDEVRGEMNRLIAHSARETEHRITGRIETEMRAQVDVLMRERARTLAEGVQDSILQALNSLTLTAQVPALREGDADRQKATLDALARRLPALCRIVVQDRSAQVTAASVSDRAVKLGKESGPEAPYFQTAMRGREYVAQDDLPAINAAPVLQLAIPIESPIGETVGVLSAHFSLEQRWNIIRNTRIGRNGFAYVMSERGRPLLTPQPAKGNALTCSEDIDPLRWRLYLVMPAEEALAPVLALKNDLAQNNRRALGEMEQHIQQTALSAAARLRGDALALRNATVHQIRTHSQGVLERMRARTKQQTGAELARLQRTLQAQTQHTQKQSAQRMSQAAQTSLSQLTARVQPLMQQALKRADNRLIVLAVLVTLISCFLSCLLALFIAGKIVRPVVRLAQVTHAIAEGDLDKRVEETAPDEIGDLAVAFNTMARSLKQSRRELDEAESQLVQSAKLASLGTLSAGVAHELNQPVAIIRGVSQQLQGEPGLSEDVLADLELIEGQTGRMIKIIQHLRTFSRAGLNEFSPVDVNQVARDCFILIGEQLRAHNIQVEFDLCEDTPPVMADANELEQVFLNLITNARDALDGQANAAITLRSRVEGETFVLEVADNGPGIPPEVAAHIFDPFFTTKEAGKGTGLGLSISHTILSKHRGEIRMENRNGAVFILTLPLAPADESLQRLAA